MCVSGGGNAGTMDRPRTVANTPTPVGATVRTATHLATVKKDDWVYNNQMVNFVSTFERDGKQFQRGQVFDYAQGGRGQKDRRRMFIEREIGPAPKKPDKPKTPVKPIVGPTPRPRDRVTTNPNGPDPRKPTRLFPDRVNDLAPKSPGVATFGERYFRRRKNSTLGDVVDPVARFGTDADYVGNDLLGSA